MAERDAPMSEQDEADATVPFGSIDALDSAHDAVSDEYEAADITVPIVAAHMWQPGPRLAARVEPRQPRQRVEQRRDPRIVGAAILIVAIAVAIALWITALWLQANDASDPEPTGDTESTISSLLVMAAGEHQQHQVVPHA